MHPPFPGKHVHEKYSRTPSEQRLARGRGELDADMERRRLIPLFAEELADTRELWLADQRLPGNSNIRLGVFLQSCVPWIAVDPEDPFAAKITWMKKRLARLQDGWIWDGVPPFGANRIELQRQGKS